MRIVVTGMGVVSPIGTSTDQFWNAAIKGTSGISVIHCFDASGLRSRIAGQIAGFNPAAFLTAKQLVKI